MNRYEICAFSTYSYEENVFITRLPVNGMIGIQAKNLAHLLQDFLLNIDCHRERMLDTNGIVLKKLLGT